MLDTDTKRRIDTARDILVGKVPDPKSQVEQITIALIYKFMDDMDAEAEELGGSRKFFSGEFIRYGWARLMRSGLGGHETLNLYAEAITKMPENPGIPQLFRGIFKNAYLPYRDPETLRMFLKVIDEFEYDHSERLGDAFEYLLSVLGSQGDAGQFRTPRHIIDFIVSVVDPKKTDTVLDPACGTAGFLISSYKHILQANTGKDGVCSLTPDERGRLASNYRGYDISPDMVRLSLVNMYLHGFTDPHIHEYDTLTSQDRWNEYADVILANPPFMSPKGGIKPHNRFSVQSKRSEVLFVDYMAEHLTLGGRAGIIVPEGIIFQSQTAYTQLRKMLVEDYLVAVVSLPAGVFQPYSGVKTSVLILDKALAKQTGSIGFFKIENDGFRLGAQRQPIDKDDLPQARIEIAEFLHRLRARESVEDFQPTLGLVVPKDKIAANGEYNLSGERYREGLANVSIWPIIPVARVFQKTEQTILPESIKGPVTYIGLENITQGTGKITGKIRTENPADIKSLKNVFKPNDILYGKLRPNLNKVWLADRKGICSTDIFVIEALEKKVVPALYAYVFRSQRFNSAVMDQIKGAQLPRIGWSSFSELDIPLPPLDVQKEIVAAIEGYQKVIDGACAVLDNYRPFIPIHPDWPMVTLGELCLFKNGVNYAKASAGHPVKIVGVGDFQTNLLAPLENLQTVFLENELNEEYLLNQGDILFVRSNGNPDLVGRSLIIPRTTFPVTFSGFTIRGRFMDERALPMFYALFFKSLDFAEAIKRVGRGANIRNLSQALLAEMTVPLPPKKIQISIVAEIEAEQALVNANHELIARMENKIQAALARVWGEGVETVTEE